MKCAGQSFLLNSNKVYRMATLNPYSLLTLTFILRCAIVILQPLYVSHVLLTSSNLDERDGGELLARLFQELSEEVP